VVRQVNADSRLHLRRTEKTTRRLAGSRCALFQIGSGELIDDVILVDQSPIGRTPRSKSVTYIKVYDGIREVFFFDPRAQARGFDHLIFHSTCRVAL